MSNDTDIARAMLAHLNTWSAKPCAIEFDLLNRKSIAMKMQPLAGTVVLRKYITGSFIGVWPFSVHVRIQKGDTAGKARALNTLDGLGKWLSGQTVPNIGVGRVAIKIEITSLPSIAAINDDGSEEYQAVYGLEYKQQ